VAAGIALAAAAGLLRRRTRLPRSIHPVFAGAPLLIAHRGGGALAPENTLAAFRSAVDDWAVDMIELDVRATADGECVVLHDATVDRTTDGTGPVSGLTLAELKRLDAGFRFTPDGGQTFPFRGRGVTVPTLDEVLTALPATRLTIEVKSADAQEPLFDTVERHAAADRIVAAGMHDADRQLFHRHAGAVSASMEQVRDFIIARRFGVAGLLPLRADTVQIPEYHGRHHVVTPGLIRALHARGLQVHVWTVNDVADMRRLLTWGVDGLVTDRPDALSALLGELYGRPPSPGHGGAAAP
jgi:glycerophosphoryl diester phosphodiesterase